MRKLLESGKIVKTVKNPDGTTSYFFEGAPDGGVVLGWDESMVSWEDMVDLIKLNKSPQAFKDAPDPHLVPKFNQNGFRW